jgi:uncharacterized protein (DUF305 family)
MKKFLVIAIALSAFQFACDRRPVQKDVPVDHNTMDHSKLGHGDSSKGAESAPYELQFLDTMIAHHQGAVDMALLADTRAGRPELKTFAGKVIEDQQKEIAQMREWRKSWYAEAPPAVNMNMPGMTEGMEGMDIKKLDSLKGNAFDLEFISQMIPHHEGALVMAKDLLAREARPEVKTLAQAITREQAAEITQMKSWQSDWEK